MSTCERCYKIVHRPCKSETEWEYCSNRFKQPEQPQREKVTIKDNLKAFHAAMDYIANGGNNG